jgi:hypothetical protein
MGRSVYTFLKKLKVGEMENFVWRLLPQARGIAADLDHRFRHVSLIVRKKQVIAVGTNHRKTHPLCKEHGYRFDSRHSELDALLRVPESQRNNMVLVNFRFNRRGEIRLSRPCAKCMPWCVATFKEVWYSGEGDILRIGE